MGLEILMTLQPALFAGEACRADASSSSLSRNQLETTPILNFHEQKLATVQSLRASE